MGINETDQLSSEELSSEELEAVKWATGLLDELGVEKVCCEVLGDNLGFEREFLWATFESDQEELLKRVVGLKVIVSYDVLPGIPGGFSVEAREGSLEVVHARGNQTVSLREGDVGISLRDALVEAAWSPRL
jgi:hypothetical protein